MHSIDAEKSRAVGPSVALADIVADERVDCLLLVVTYNSQDAIAHLLDSIPAAAGSRRVRAVVVDNASQDRTVEIVEQGYPEVKVVEAGQNLGYSGGINIGRRYAGLCSTLMILNADMVLEPRSLEELLRVLRRSGAGIVVPVLRKGETKSLSLRREPSIGRCLGDALFGNHWRQRPGWLSEIIWDVAAYEEEREVDWATGAGWLVSSECDQAVGPWDTQFFLYSEEVDYANRARSKGFSILYAPTAQLRHDEGGSGSSIGQLALMAVNRVRYYEKRHGAFASLMFRGLVGLHHLLRSYRPGHLRVARTVLWRSSWNGLDPRSVSRRSIEHATMKVDDPLTQTHEARMNARLAGMPAWRSERQKMP